MAKVKQYMKKTTTRKKANGKVANAKPKSTRVKKA